MKKTDYLPSLTAVYLDPSSSKFLYQTLTEDLWDIMIKKIDHCYPNIKIIVGLDKDLFSKFQSSNFPFLNRLELENVETELEFLRKIGGKLPPSKWNDPDWDEVNFLYLKGLTPLLDVDLMKESFSRHKKFFSQYSYSENLPEGIIPTIITREFLSSLPEAVSSDVHSFFLKNINQYDVDIFFVAPDLRQFRLDFRVNQQRNFQIIQSLLSVDQNLSYRDILPKIKENPKIFRIAPSFIEWEIYRGCELNCTFCPRQLIEKDSDNQHISVNEAKLIVSKLNQNIHTSFSICLGGNGEPLLHPQLFEITNEILESSQLNELMIETALYKNVESLFQWLGSLSEEKKKKLSFIVNLSTLNKEVYASLYGKDLYDTVLGNLLKLKDLVPKDSLYVQMIKMVEVGDEVDSYFTFFEKQQINVILQKYNTFAHKLKERRVSDLTPIHREFCWHLNRDLSIDVRGNVNLCKQEWKHQLGNLIHDSFGEIWERGDAHFHNSLIGKHESIPAPCLNCDEWYTFNA
ncbi:Spiro-SPASM protein [Leptospira ryugenii]|uniref:Spiro-SPASM protein n=1 Tax=Leptospira ryugenii TaxID=1917863 RepID=A0A2P2E2N5_9LEPT|nr:spiro-SPASM protein [Leptospira ryugenii]GBF51165.1 Spiro-SPASM protein [Leptospira ryugenii]